jgi:hypothetical protein
MQRAEPNAARSRSTDTPLSRIACSIASPETGTNTRIEDEPRLRMTAAGRTVTTTTTYSEMFRRHALVGSTREGSRERVWHDRTCAGEGLAVIGGIQ